MKDKVLETVITQSAEHIARALRNYSGEPMVCKIYVETRMHAHDGGDAYGIRVFFKKNRTLLMEPAGEVQYVTQEDGSEAILRTEDADDFQI